MLRRDRVEQGADLVITGNAGDAKQALGVGAPLSMAECLLVGQKGGRLREEDSESSQGSVLHRVLGVLAAAQVGQLVEPVMEGVHEGITAE